jgi:DNA-directed RNA polymerase specialized sigma24 family protein
MSDGDSVSVWLDGLKMGNGPDIQRLWDRYFQRLVRLAATRLPVNARRALDEEDIALSAFQSFCDRVGRGQFPQLDDREDLWRLLATITTRKVFDSLRHQNRQKRGGGRIVGESALPDRGTTVTTGMAQFLSREPTPEVTVQFAEYCERLLDKLEDPGLKSVALRKLDGQSTGEIASEMGVTTRTVDRKLKLIRAIWEAEIAP